MRLFVECKPDEALVVALGVPKGNVEHAAGRAGVCAQLQRLENVIGMVDEDPDAQPSRYLQALPQIAWTQEIRVLTDSQRNNRVIILSPRLEPWLVRSAKSAGLRMTEFGFESDDGKGLHSEINQRLANLKKLVTELVAKQEARILALKQALFT